MTITYIEDDNTRNFVAQEIRDTINDAMRTLQEAVSTDVENGSVHTESAMNDLREVARLEELVIEYDNR